MSIIGRALARLARKSGGQLMLELPDDLQPAFVAQILEGANQEVATDPQFALFVHGRRQDVSVISPRVDFRELAMYRQGAHLAVSFASDNRGMSTYASVYPLLLSNGFPSSDTSSGGTGVAGLREFARCLGDVLAERFTSHGLSAGDFQKATQSIVAFLGASYEAAGGGQSSFAADWWLHVDQWVNTLTYAQGKPLEITGVKLLYGAAGLPVPATGHSLDMHPRDYIKVLKDRWPNPPAIITELARLEGMEATAEAARFLSRLDWQRHNAQTTLRTDSIVALVAMADGEDALDRIKGWGSLAESSFKDSFVEAKGKLGIRHNGAELVQPWNAASQLLVAKASESIGSSGTLLQIENIELVVPFKPDRQEPSKAQSAAILASQVEVSGIRGCTARLDCKSSQVLPDGLHLIGTLLLTPATKARNLAWIEASTSGEAARIFADRCNCSLTLLRSDEVAIWAKPQGRAKKSALRGPVIWSRTEANTGILEVPGSGIYDLAIAWGESAGFDVTTATKGGNISFSIGWPGMENVGAKASADISESKAIQSRGEIIFHIELSSNEERHLSPIVAAAHGLRPDTSRLLEESAFDYLEAELGGCLAHLETGHALGCILATISRKKDAFVAIKDGILCSPELISCQGSELCPGAPSQHLLAHPAYIQLLESYSSLGIPSAIADLEVEEGSAGLTVSRLALDFISSEKIDRLVRAYLGLLEDSDDFSPTDRFWARNPFSVVVFEEGAGYRSAKALMLSPLHPIRLVWIWSLQVGLREAHDDGAKPVDSLAMLDGTNFPSSLVFQDQFGTPSTLIPVAVDQRPGGLYLGWHASVSIVNHQAIIPGWVAGYRFPVDGLSALSASSVSSAIDDFLRVAPHVQLLHIGLTSINPVQRSSSIDNGLLVKIRELALGSSGLDGVSGVRITDSEARLGSTPLFSGIEDSIASARPGFNVQWTSAPAGHMPDSHIAFLEGNAALLAMEPSKRSGKGWLPSLPLRRTPLRMRHGAHSSLEYALAEPIATASVLWKTLHAYETPSTYSYTLKILHNPVGISGRPGWLVAGDFGVDPRAISRAIKDQSNADYILWDWRPITTVKATSEANHRAQSYFIMASVPPALSNAIKSRLHQLNPELSGEDLNYRARLLVSTLAERAIGLNTLLSIGHHQATGALGFYFALRSIATWMESPPPNEIRLVIPVDAVDPFLRASISDAGDGSRKRADLLAVRGYFPHAGRPLVVFAPIEIKHYGLANGEEVKAFPLAGEARLNEHAEQLASYQDQLECLCATYRDSAGSQASLLGQRLAAVLDAAIQLGSCWPQAAAGLLAGVAACEVDIVTGKGILLWYQARATGLDGERASWSEAIGSGPASRNDVRIDPAAFDACFWGTETGLAHEIVREALDDATFRATEEPYAEPNTAPTLTDEPFDQQRLEAEIDSGEAPPLHEGPLATISGLAPSLGVGNSAATERADHTTSEDTPSALPSPRSTRDKMDVVELEKRYSSLLGALSEFNVKVERPRGEQPYQEGPAFIEYAISPSYGVSVNKIESQLENLKLRLKLPSDAEIGCSTHKGNVLLTVPKTDDERYFVDATELWSRWRRPESGFKVPVGEDASGEIVELDFANSNSPHLLIAGVTGSGKSEALLTILHGAARFYSPEELQFRLIDPKQTELNTLASMEHAQGSIGWSGQQALEILEHAVEEMENRYKMFREAGERIRSISEYQSAVAPMARWIIVLDEYADLISDDAERKRIEKCLQRLSQKARAAGIHVIVSTQKPVVQVVNTVVKGNLPGKIALRVNTSMESRVILDEPGAEKLVGKGDAIVRAGSGRVRVQFARYKI